MEPPSNISRAASDRGLKVHLHVHGNLIHIPYAFQLKTKWEVETMCKILIFACNNRNLKLDK